MLKNIEVQKNVITIESLAFFRPAKQTLERLGDYFADAGSAISKLLAKLSTTNVAVTIDGREFIPLVEKASYVELSRLRIAYPKEFTGDYKTVCTVMQNVGEIPETLYRDLLVPFATWLALVLNQPAKMESLNQYVNINLDRSRLAREQLEKVTKGGSQSAVPYNRAVRKNEDWVSVIDTMNEIAAKNNNVQIDDIRKKVKEVDELLNLLIQKMNEPRFEYRPSGVFVERLVNITFAMASEIEFYAEYQYLYSALLESVRDDVTFLTKHLK